MMFSVCTCSFIFILTSSLFGMPISGTHTVVGALLGAGISVVGADSLNWQQMIKIVASWFISPVMAAVLSFFNMNVVMTLVQNNNLSFRVRILMQQLIWAMVFLIIGYILDDLL